MSNWNQVYEYVEAIEGGYNANDEGAMAYMGLNRRYTSDWAGWSVVDAYMNEFGQLKWNTLVPNSFDSGLSYSAETYLKNNYFYPSWANKINNQSLANTFTDFTINAGQGNSVTRMQMALNSVGFDVAVDGAMGNETMTAINKANQSRLFDAFQNERMEHYKSIGGSNLDPWLERVSLFGFIPTTTTGIISMAGLGLIALGILGVVYLKNK